MVPILLLSTAATASLMPLALLFLRRRSVLDVPTARSSHSEATVRGGGVVALAVVPVICLVFDRSAPVLATVILATASGLIGLADDLRGGLAPGTRLVGQAAIASIAVPITLSLTETSWWWLLAIPGIVGVVGYVNAFNFMDGVNGISGLQVVVASLSFAGYGFIADAPGLTVVGAALAGSAIGFLPFNVPRARVFLGDAGSFFFGGALGMCAVLAVAHGLPIDVAVAPLTIYLTDTASTLVHRHRRGERLTEPHRDHVYQRLVIERGWSHLRVAITVAGFSAGCTALAGIRLVSESVLSVVADLGILALMTVYVRLRAVSSASAQPFETGDARGRAT